MSGQGRVVSAMNAQEEKNKNASAMKNQVSQEIAKNYLRQELFIHTRQLVNLNTNIVNKLLCHPKKKEK